MAAILDWFTWTRTIGLLAYATPLVLWLFLRLGAGARARRSRVLAVVAGIDFALLLDMIFNLRWKLHDLLAGDAAAHDLYSTRRPYQVRVLEILAVLLVCAVVVVLVRIRRRGAAMALAGALLSTGMWCEEVISYHFIDAVFYRQIGPAYAICLIWMALSVITTAGIWIETRS